MSLAKSHMIHDAMIQSQISRARLISSPRATPPPPPPQYHTTPPPATPLLLLLPVRLEQTEEHRTAPHRLLQQMASLINKTVSSSQADACEATVLEKNVASGVASGTSDCCSGSTNSGTQHVPEEAGVELGGGHAAPGFDGALGRDMTRELSRVSYDRIAWCDMLQRLQYAELEMCRSSRVSALVLTRFTAAAVALLIDPTCCLSKATRVWLASRVRLVDLFYLGRPASRLD